MCCLQINMKRSTFRHGVQESGKKDIILQHPDQIILNILYTCCKDQNAIKKKQINILPPLLMTKPTTTTITTCRRTTINNVARPKRTQE